MKIETDKLLPYRVGGLLYTPALNQSVAEKIVSGLYGERISIAFCLEDSVDDFALKEAERQLIKILRVLSESEKPLPMLFVRIRTPMHMKYIHNMLGDLTNILTGYILPKFDTSNMREYSDLIKVFNEDIGHKLYIMPILESKEISDALNRLDILHSIKNHLDIIKEYVLNIRVGGNDFCNLYAVRRSVRQSIYDIGVVRDILMDILNVFASDYVVSGPVWEYFGDDDRQDWAVGLKAELELDKLNGFIGKTAIHPSQIPIINNCLKVSNTDFEDAKSILNTNQDGLAVEKNIDGTRMNERKCHEKWAKKIMIRAKVYGIHDYE